MFHSMTSQPAVNMAINYRWYSSIAPIMMRFHIISNEALWRPWCCLVKARIWWYMAISAKCHFCSVCLDNQFLLSYHGYQDDLIQMYGIQGCQWGNRPAAVYKVRGTNNRPELMAAISWICKAVFHLLVAQTCNDLMANDCTIIDRPCLTDVEL